MLKHVAGVAANSGLDSRQSAAPSQPTGLLIDDVKPVGCGRRHKPSGAARRPSSLLMGRKGTSLECSSLLPVPCRESTMRQAQATARLDPAPPSSRQRGQCTTSSSSWLLLSPSEPSDACEYTMAASSTCNTFCGCTLVGWSHISVSEDALRVLDCLPQELT